jgi:hypothetical protein
MASIKKRGARWFARYRDDTGHEHGQRFDRKIDAQRWLDAQTTALVTGVKQGSRKRSSMRRRQSIMVRSRRPGPAQSHNS